MCSFTVVNLLDIRHQDTYSNPINGFPDDSDGKESSYNTGHPGSIPESGRAFGEGHGNPLQYSCLENPRDRGAWWATVHGSQRVRCDWAFMCLIVLLSSLAASSRWCLYSAEVSDLWNCLSSSPLLPCCFSFTLSSFWLCPCYWSSLFILLWQDYFSKSHSSRISFL